jgi:hypothetical protein
VRRTSPKEQEAVLRLDGQARFEHFIKRAADEEQVYSLWRDGWVVSETDDGVQLLPLWPAAEYADLCRTGDWKDCEVRKIELVYLMDDLLPRIGEQGFLPGVFPTPEGKATTPTVVELLSALNEELKKY